jgi:type IV pilus assembly protein PilQ
MRSTLIKHVLAALSCLLLGAFSVAAWAATPGEIVHVTVDAKQKLVTLQTRGDVGNHEARVIANPNRLVIDFPGAILGKVPPKLTVSSDQIHEVRLGLHKGHARAVIDFLNTPIPAFMVKRANDRVLVGFGEAVSQILSMDKMHEPRALPGAPSAKPQFTATPAPAPAPMPASAQLPRKELHFEPMKLPTGTRSVAGAADTKNLAQSKSSPLPAAYADKGKLQGVPPAPANLAGDKRIRLAQATPERKPNDVKPPATPPAPEKPLEATLDKKPGDFPAQQTPGAGDTRTGGGGMVREVRPPVTPPTPDPRLLVQQITELKFIQVGHNARLVVRGGDHLDYRMNKVSPTKVRLDLINAEIPKVHQKPLRTDLFSTSVEMIVPGSQTIFIQLKDAVPYQVEKKKGVLMIDFPPPRFALTDDQKGALAAQGPPSERQAQTQAQEARDALLQRREAAKIRKQHLLSEQAETAAKQIRDLLKQQEDIVKERKEIDKKYPLVVPDPEVFNKPVTMDFQGIALKNAFRLLAEQAGINVIVGAEVTGATTLRLFQVPLGQVIDHLLVTNKLAKDMRGNVMWVGSQETIAASKQTRMNERRALVEEVAKKFAANKQAISDLEKKREQVLKDMAAAEVEEEAVPEETTAVETVGATETIEIDGEPVTLLLIQVRMSYRRARDIRTILECVFNRRCDERAGAAPPPAPAGTPEAGATAQEQRSRALEAAGFQPGSPGYQARMEALQRQERDQARTQAAQQIATQVPGQPGAALTPEQDERMQRILRHTVIWSNDTFNMLFIKDLPERIEDMKKLIMTLDVPTPQVLIESRIVQANRDWGRGLGIRWGGRQTQTGVVLPNGQSTWGLAGSGGAATSVTGGTLAGAGPPTTIPSQFAVDLGPAIGNLTAPLMGLNFNFGLLNTANGITNYLTDLDARLLLGEAQNKVKIISRPKVQVLDGQAASITRGRQIAYATVSAEGTQTQLVDVDLKLTVTPRIYPDGRIQMQVSVSDNNVANVTVNGLAAIDTRKANTTMIVKDGETAVIGGVTVKTDNNSRQGLPGLMNLPVLNFFFSNKSVDTSIGELLIFLTPTIIKRPPPAA